MPPSAGRLTSGDVGGGAALSGLLGTFLATPVAAVIAVLVRFGVERWRRSDYFREAAPIPASPPPRARPD